jgi:hypothetical protein
MNGHDCRCTLRVEVNHWGPFAIPGGAEHQLIKLALGDMPGEEMSLAQTFLPRSEVRDTDHQESSMGKKGEKAATEDRAQ